MIDPKNGFKVNFKTKSELNFRTKFEICRSNDSSFDGIFYLAVKTTKIVCLPSCKARFPLLENIIFYDSIEDASEKGFRPCKRCQPHKFPNNYPDWLDIIKEFIDVHFTEFIPDQVLTNLVGVDATTIRRYIKKYFGKSLKAYQRQLRLLYADQLLTEGRHLDEIYKKCGFNTLKGFKEAYKREFGFYPVNIIEQFKLR